MATEKLSVEEAAERFNRTTRSVTNYLAEGMPHTGKGNKRWVLWPAARAWLDDKLREEGANRARPSTLDEARLRRETADAELKELELAERRGELMTVTEGERILGEAFARARSKLVNLPPAIAMRVVGQTVAQRQSQAQVLCDEVMAELATMDDVLGGVEAVA